MLHLLGNVRKRIWNFLQNKRLYSDFNNRKRQLELISKEQTINFLVPQIVKYILETDNYLITFKQAERLARTYLTYFKYKDLYLELDNYTEKLW